MANKNYEQYIFPVGMLLLVFVGGKKLFEALGLADNKSDRENKSELDQSAKANYFDPDFWKSGGAGTKILTMDSARKLATLIYDAKGLLNDNEAQVYGVFQSLRYQSQVSFLAAVFFATYKQSMAGYMQGFLNTAEMATVARICNKLPKYR